MDALKNKQLVLASKSPRRRELMLGLGLPFAIKTKEGNEDFPLDMEATEVAKYLARKKAMAFRDDLDQHDLVITADTVVILNGEILNKPKDKKEALYMLQQLSGNVHQVITGVCLLDRNKTVCFDDRTEVHFGRLEERELIHYIENFRPFDKA